MLCRHCSTLCRCWCQCFATPMLVSAMPAPCVPSPCHAVANPCISLPTLRRATPRRIDSFRCLNQTTLRYTIAALYPANHVVAMPSHRNAQICTAVAGPFHTMPLPNVSLQILSLANLYFAETVQIESMLCLCCAMLYRALDMPDLAATILCLSLRRGAVPMPSSSLPCQSNSQLCSALAPLSTAPLCPNNAVCCISCALRYFAFAFFLRNRSALPPTTEPSSPISSHTNAPLPEFLHWPNPLYFP